MKFIVILGLGLAGALDLRFRKVPNWLTFAMAITGILFQAVDRGISGFQESLLGLALGILLLYIPFALGGMGGGDVKLLGATGALVGPAILLKVFLASAIFGGIFSVFEIIRKKSWGRTFQSLKNRILHLFLTGRAVSESEIDFSVSPIHIPYALAMGCGYLWIYFLGGV